MSGILVSLVNPQTATQSPHFFQAFGFVRGLGGLALINQHPWKFPFFNGKYTDVSKDSGTPKSPILFGFSSINHPFWGTPIFGNTHIFYMYMGNTIFFNVWKYIIFRWWLNPYDFGNISHFSMGNTSTCFWWVYRSQARVHVGRYHQHEILINLYIKKKSCPMTRDASMGLVYLPIYHKK